MQPSEFATSPTEPAPPPDDWYSHESTSRFFLDEPEYDGTEVAASFDAGGRTAVAR